MSSSLVCARNEMWSIGDKIDSNASRPMPELGSRIRESDPVLLLGHREDGLQDLEPVVRAKGHQRAAIAPTNATTSATTSGGSMTRSAEPSSSTRSISASRFADSASMIAFGCT